MTTKEASWVIKKTAEGKRVNLKYKNIDCENMTDDDLRQKFKFSSENNFQNPFSGIYIYYDKSLTQQYSMCIKQSNANCVYQANIANIDLVRE